MSDTAEPDDVSDVAASILDLLPAQGTSEDPLYLQLAGAMRRLIDRGELRGGASLPSERVLSKATGFSRVTVRNALKELFRDGLVSRRQGAGSYVSPHVDQPLSLLIGFTADMARRGAAAHSVVLAKSVGLPGIDEMLKLGLSPNDQVTHLTRVRHADGEPLAIEHAVVPRFALDPETVGDSLYDALRLGGHMPVRALQRLRAAIADEREAGHLDILVGAPILHIERLAFLPNGRPIEMTRSSYRGDRYDFIAELKIEP